MKKRVPVCRVKDLPPGERQFVDVDGRSICVFNIHGEFYALKNVCPHQFAPLCEGKVTGYCEESEVGEYRWTRDGEIIRCPWHGWEFDIKTGKSIFNPHRVRTKSYPVETGKVPAEEDPAVDTYPVEVADEMILVVV